MGCDIHLHVEVKVRLREGSEPRWRHVTRSLAVREYEFDRTIHQPWYADRNYAAFGMLAGVRGLGYEPLSPPRGLPGDISAEVQDESVNYGDDGHSHSWLTLRELMNDEYWDQGVGAATYRDHAGGVLTRLVPALRELIEYEGVSRVHKTNKDKRDYLTEDDVRIVFWFDN